MNFKLFLFRRRAVYLGKPLGFIKRVNILGKLT